MNITQTSLNDIDEVAVLFDLYRQFYDCEPDLEKARQFLTDRLGNNESTIFVARDDSGKAVGFVQLYPTFCSVEAIKILVLYDLYVMKEQRRSGAGEQLMNRTTAYAREVGAGRIDLSTAIDNHTAQSLYEKLGYERDDEFYAYSLDV